ncbi:MAG TPA: VOC family protein [Ilumatobacteraceae bacterium]|nr:VOC family protein [Ilumatobacteraceae bacterium]
MNFQVAVDCADPHRLNKYWSELLGYQREEDPDFVQRMVDEGLATEADTIEIEGKDRPACVAESIGIIYGA